jgi:hypothetical protein
MTLNPIALLVGQAFARSLGVTEPRDQTTVGVATMAVGLNPIGILVTRQLALQRVTPPVVSVSASTGSTASAETAQAIARAKAASALSANRTAEAAGSPLMRALPKRRSPA